MRHIEAKEFATLGTQERVRLTRSLGTVVRLQSRNDANS